MRTRGLIVSALLCVGCIGTVAGQALFVREDTLAQLRDTRSTGSQTGNFNNFHSDSSNTNGGRSSRASTTNSRRNNQRRAPVAATALDENNQQHQQPQQQERYNQAPWDQPHLRYRNSFDNQNQEEDFLKTSASQYPRQQYQQQKTPQYQKPQNQFLPKPNNNFQKDQDYDDQSGNANSQTQFNNNQQFTNRFNVNQFTGTGNQFGRSNNLQNQNQYSSLNSNNNNNFNNNNNQFNSNQFSNSNNFNSDDNRGQFRQNRQFQNSFNQRAQTQPQQQAINNVNFNNNSNNQQRQNNNGRRQQQQNNNGSSFNNGNSFANGNSLNNFNKFSANNNPNELTRSNTVNQQLQNGNSNRGQFNQNNFQQFQRLASQQRSQASQQRSSTTSTPSPLAQADAQASSSRSTRVPSQPQSTVAIDQTVQSILNWIQGMSRAQERRARQQGVSQAAQLSRQYLPVPATERPRPFQPAPTTPGTGTSTSRPRPTSTTPPPPPPTEPARQQVSQPSRQYLPVPEEPAPGPGPGPAPEQPAPVPEQPTPEQPAPTQPAPQPQQPQPEAPVTQAPRPFETPSPETQPPYADTPAPPVETPAPPAETPAPPVETPAPPQETPAPIPELPGPAPEPETPVPAPPVQTEPPTVATEAPTTPPLPAETFPPETPAPEIPTEAPTPAPEIPTEAPTPAPEIPTEAPATPGPAPEAPAPTEAPVVTDTDTGLHPPHIHAIDVQCAKDMMTINIEFDKPYDGIIYSKGYFKDPNCRYVQPNSNQIKYSFTVMLNSCGTQFVDDFAGTNQAYLENVIVLQNEEGIQEVWDSIRSVRCLWEGNLKQALTVALSVGSLNQEIVTFGGDTGMAKLDIQMGRGPFAPAANGLVKIGELMTLVVSVEGDPGFDVQVRACAARDADSTNLVQLTDNDGCVLKPKLLGAFQKTKDTGNTGASIIAYAFFQAFKFPDVMDLIIECSVDLCKNDCEMCPNPNQKLEPGARRRRREAWLADAENGNYSLASSDDLGVVMGRRLRVFTPDELPADALLELTQEVVNATQEAYGNTVINMEATAGRSESVCMSMPGFVVSSAVMLTLLAGSSLLSAVLWIKLQRSQLKEHRFARAQ